MSANQQQTPQLTDDSFEKQTTFRLRTDGAGSLSLCEGFRPGLDAVSTQCHRNAHELTFLKSTREYRLPPIDRLAVGRSGPEIDKMEAAVSPGYTGNGAAGRHLPRQSFNRRGSTAVDCPGDVNAAGNVCFSPAL
jgi:hypothetical protein